MDSCTSKSLFMHVDSKDTDKSCMGFIFGSFEILVMTEILIDLSQYKGPFELLHFPVIFLKRVESAVIKYCSFFLHLKDPFFQFH